MSIQSLQEFFRDFAHWLEVCFLIACSILMLSSLSLAIGVGILNMYNPYPCIKYSMMTQNGRPFFCPEEVEKT